MRVCVFMLATAALGWAQADSPNYPYLLRLAHETDDRYSCVLLQKTGAFHVEVTTGESTKVLEGRLDERRLQVVQQELRDPFLASLEQSQIDEPLIRSQEDRLRVSIVRQDGWQDLNFQSLESRRPFERALKPLLRWMDDLHKVPHRNLTEDSGKNSCQPAKVLALKKRIFPAAQPSQAPAPSVSPDRASGLLRVYSFSLKSGSAHQQCVLVTESGKYRFEDRAQKAENKPVVTGVFTGELSSTDVQELRKLLDAPALVKLKHREPPGGRVPVMGDILNLTISRPGGDQKLFLSDGFGRQVGAFFGGDGPIAVADPLKKFLAQHVESNPAAITLDPTARNNCDHP
ncbi:MAG TPA: hypothetical protein VF133_02875 [Terriglobales bacterium]